MQKMTLTPIVFSRKNTVLVALYKLGIPIGTPSDESFNIKNVYFIDRQIDLNVINDIILQIPKGYCDHLFYIDPDKHFAANDTPYAFRNAAKRYVNEVLAKSTLDRQRNLMTPPKDWDTLFSLGEFKPILIFKD